MSIRKNVFDLSHERKLSCDMGKLIPIMCEEVLPGDYFNANTSLVVRISPLLAPIMHRVDVFTHYYFVPNRLIWDNWENFITGGPDGKAVSAWPMMWMNNIAEGSLADYFGLPIGVMTADLEVSALPFRAYTKIFNEWYRDENLQNPEPVVGTDGGDMTTNTDLLSRNWEKDYFTSALPWPQKGDAVTLALASTAPVVGTGDFVKFHNGSGQELNLMSSVGTNDVDFSDVATATGAMFPGKAADNTETGYEADLANATAMKINDLRQAIQIQKWMEKNARAGSRYVESTLAHWGVRSSDARLQRPEFLGGGRSPVVVSEVLQTSETSAQSAQGNMAGHGFSAQSGHAFSRSFEEHGYIIGLMTIMPRTSYQQGIPRAWTRKTKFDYAWPEFVGLGEQAILNKELYATGTTAQDEGIFGYIGRYDEYRRRESSVHGQFRTSLDFWHMGRKFQAAPTLTSSFITADPTKRINAVTDEHNCLVQVYNSVKAVRALPLVAEPTL